MENQITQTKLLNVKEAAGFLNIAVPTLYNWVSQGRIPVIKISGRCIRFRLSDLHAFLDQKTALAR